jgi:hypothetical protein
VYPPCSITYNYTRLPYVSPLQPGDLTPTPTRKQPAQTAPKPPKTSSQPNNATQDVDAKLLSHDLFADEEPEDYTFENEELLAEPQLDCFDVREVSVQHDPQDVIWDSGASNNVTGNRCALFNFKELSKPISIRVATDTTNICNFT